MANGSSVYSGLSMKDIIVRVNCKEKYLASRRVLKVQLNELEAHDLIEKKIFTVVPPKVEYSLTPFEKKVIPVIGALGKWAAENENRLRDLITGYPSRTVSASMYNSSASVK